MHFIQIYFPLYYFGLSVDSHSQSQIYKSSETKGRTQMEYAMGTVRDITSQAKKKVSETAQVTSETSQDAEERTDEAKDSTGSYLQEKLGDYAKETTQAGAQKTGGMLSRSSKQLSFESYTFYFLISGM
ncbi:hypothetical protein MKX01_004338 [Papaver californicum]|nr:hypothetical protein MKX01_004338 [Papaver californicum]